MTHSSLTRHIAAQTQTRTDTIIYRRGSPADYRGMLAVFLKSLNLLAFQVGAATANHAVSESDLDLLMSERKSLLDHIASQAEEWWVAEENGEIIGFARSILRHGVFELSELFVTPDTQSAGVGAELLRRAFPTEVSARRRVILATLDLRAQARYHKAGLAQRCAIYTFYKQPEARAVCTDLEFRRITASPETLGILAAIDHAIIDQNRDADHLWLMQNREGYLYYRNGAPVGYGYVGHPFSGPFALLDSADTPAALAHAENHAYLKGFKSFGVDVPMLNMRAVNHLLDQGFRMSAFICFLMSDVPFGRMKNYIFTAPLYHI